MSIETIGLIVLGIIVAFAVVKFVIRWAIRLALLAACVAALALVVLSPGTTKHLFHSASQSVHSATTHISADLPKQKAKHAGQIRKAKNDAKAIEHKHSKQISGLRKDGQDISHVVHDVKSAANVKGDATKATQLVHRAAACASDAAKSAGRELAKTGRISNVRCP